MSRVAEQDYQAFISRPYTWEQDREHAVISDEPLFFKVPLVADATRTNLTLIPLFSEPRPGGHVVRIRYLFRFFWTQRHKVTKPRRRI